MGVAAVAVAAAAVLTVVAPAGAAARSGSTARAASTAPGVLIASQAVTAAGVNGSAYLVEYWSESVPANTPVKVTGMVYVPTGIPPVGGWPVVSWAHGTDGSNGSCAPSLNPATDVPNINSLLAKGWVVAASDYQGEANANILTGSSGILPYLVGQSAARNTIDIVRAARHLAAAHASTHYVVWGHSEGGQTAMFVLKIAGYYAGGLHLDGVLALAPPSNLNSAELPYAEGTLNWPFLFLAVGGFNAAYGNTLAPLSQVLTPLGMSDLPLLNTDCLATLANALFAQGFSKVFTISAGGQLPTQWKVLANLNDPANFTAARPVPLVIVSGDADTTVLPSTTASLASELCALSPTQNLERWLYAGLTHGGIVTSATINDYVQWTQDRFAGDPSPGFYTPTGSGANTATVTNLCG